MSEIESVPSEWWQRSTVGNGVLLGILLIAVAQVPALFLGLFWIVFFGATQLVAIVPAAVYLGAKGQWPLFKGVLIVAGIAFLVNSICAAIVISQLDFG